MRIFSNFNISSRTFITQSPVKRLAVLWMVCIICIYYLMYPHLLNHSQLTSSFPFLKIKGIFFILDSSYFWMTQCLCERSCQHLGFSICNFFISRKSLYFSSTYTTCIHDHTLDITITHWTASFNPTILVLQLFYW